ncbi:MAG: hypothetical protein ACOC1P_03110 [Minisyncoccales bacterium]
MSELKTLKNFETFYNGVISFNKLDEKDNPKDFWVNKEELRQEAIKWVKELKKKEHSIDLQEDELILRTIKDNLFIFKYFFNITDKDLGEKEK